MDGERRFKGARISYRGRPCLTEPCKATGYQLIVLVTGGLATWFL